MFNAKLLRQVISVPGNVYDLAGMITSIPGNIQFTSAPETIPNPTHILLGPVNANGHSLKRGQVCHGPGLRPSPPTPRLPLVFFVSGWSDA